LTLNLLERTTVQFPATAIERELEPLDAKTEPQTRFNWWWKTKKKT
jgi:hypothetical protein